VRLWTGSPGIRGGAQEKPGVEGEERRQERRFPGFLMLGGGAVYYALIMD
jgi:hypothetical protein